MSSLPVVTPPRSTRPARLSARLLEPLLALSEGVLPTLLLGLVILAPLLWEGLPPLAGMTLELVLAAVVLTWYARRLAAPVPAPVGPLPITLPLAALTLVAAFQLIPLPLSLATRLNPTLAGVAANTWPLLPRGLLPAWVPLSAAPGDTLGAAVRLILGVGLLLVVRDMARGHAFRRSLMHTLLLVGALELLVGFVHGYLQAESIYFVPDGPPHGLPFFGSYIGQNRNAAFFNLLWPLALSLAMEGLSGPGTQRRSGNQLGLLKPAGEGLLPALYYGVLAAGLLAGVVACRSRMAWAVAGWGLALLAVLLLARAGRRLWAALLFVVSVGLLGILPWLQSARFLRLVSDWADKTPELNRMQIWPAAWQMAQDHRLVGVGLGTFSKSFGPYNPLSHGYVPLHPESFYLEVLIELGIPGLLLTLCVLVGGLWILLRTRFWEAGDGRQGVLGLGVGLLGMAAHAVLDPTPRGYGNLVVGVVAAGVLLASLGAGQRSDFDPALRYGPAPRRAWLPVLLLPVFGGFSFTQGLAGFVSDQVLTASETSALSRWRPALNRLAPLAPWSTALPLARGMLELRDAEALLKRAANEKPEVSRQTLDEVPGRLRLARGYLELALLRAPMSGHAQRLAARAAQLQADRTAALSFIRDAVRVQPHDYRSQARLAATLYWLKEDEQALAAFARTLQLVPDSGVAAVVRELFRAAGRNVARADAVIPESSDWRINYEWGTFLLQQGALPQAQARLKQLLKSQDALVPELAKAGWLVLRAGDRSLARGLAQHLRQYHPEASDGFGLEAELRLAEGDASGAMALLEQAAKLNPPGVEEQLRVVEILEKQGKGEDALRRLSAMREQRLGQAAVPLAQARIFLGLQQWSAAAQMLRDAMVMSPELEEPRWQLHALHTQMGLATDAAQDLAGCLKLKVAPRCRAKAGLFAFEKKSYAEAVTWLTEAVAQGTPDAATLALLGEALLEQRDKAGAARALEKALALNAQEPRALTLAARLGQ